MSAHDLQDLRRMRAARNQSLFREVNERVEGIAKSFDLDAGQLDFMCECAHTDCTERLQMSVTEYEAIRRIPNHFAIVDGHQVDDVETVVAQADRYLVVAKTGIGRELAEKLDPRQTA